MDKDENLFADAFSGKLSTEEESLQYIRYYGDLVSSDPIKKQIAIDRIVDKVVYGKKDKPDKTFWDTRYNVLQHKSELDAKVNHPAYRNLDYIYKGIVNMGWLFIIFTILYAIFNHWS